MATARQLLLDYGYAEDKNTRLYTPARPSSEVWQHVEGGWLCFQRGSASQGVVWGREAADLPGYIQVPFTQLEAFKDVSGLNPGIPDHEAFFQWVWPEERLVEIYTYSAANTPEGKQWVKNNEGGYKLVNAE